MTKRLPATAAPVPLEAYAAQFDDLFARRSQREGFWRYLAGLLLPAERNKTATGLANSEPTVGAQHPRAQALQGFLSESTWDPDAVNARRLALLRAAPATAPDARGVLVIDEHGDRKWGRKTAHVGRQYLANLGKTDSGVQDHHLGVLGRAERRRRAHELHPRHQHRVGGLHRRHRRHRQLPGADIHDPDQLHATLMTVVAIAEARTILTTVFVLWCLLLISWHQLARRRGTDASRSRWGWWVVALGGCGFPLAIVLVELLGYRLDRQVLRLVSVLLWSGFFLFVVRLIARRRPRLDTASAAPAPIGGVWQRLRRAFGGE